MNDVKAWDLFPFSQFKAEDYKPLIFEKLKKAESDIETIIYQTDAPTFSNTILRIENNSQIYNRFVDVFFNLNSACTDETIRDDAHEIAETLSVFSNKILLNERLFRRVEKVYQNDYVNKKELDEESLRLLKETYDSFVRNGALLDDKDKERIRAIDAELSRLTLAFSDNVLEETNNDYLHVEDEAEISGMTEVYLKMYKKSAQEKGLTGYVIGLQSPAYIPFMKYCSNRSLRELLYQKYMTRGYRNNEYNNTTVIRNIVSLRQERANILGYDSHAHFVLEKRMAKTPDRVISFLEELYMNAWPHAQRDAASLQPVAEKWGIGTLQAYDHAFLAEQLKKELHDFSDEDLKPYLSLDNCLTALFRLSKDLYGLDFRLIEEADRYHEDVAVYEVTEEDQFKAIVYTDFYMRENKKPGAWMTVYKNQKKEGLINVRPHVSIVCNFRAPQDDSPVLLSFDEFTTLFHEWGHALHGMLADTKYESMSGTNVYWDFVELPSQFMENFCYNKGFLESWAKHYETGAIMPEELIDKVIGASRFMEAYQTVRQLSFGMLDMAYYAGAQDVPEDIISFEREVTGRTQLYPSYRDAILSTSFSHIFGGGYDSGYYSYKWAEVLDADAYKYLEDNDFDPLIVSRFKKLMSSGGTEEPMELYKSFRGSEPDPSALLRRAGIEK